MESSLSAGVGRRTFTLLNKGFLLLSSLSIPYPHTHITLPHSTTTCQLHGNKKEASVLQVDNDTVNVKFSHQTVKINVN